MNMLITCFLLGMSLPVLPAEAAEVPPHIARGHLLAAFCVSSSEKNPKQVTAIYREIVPVAAPAGSYTTAACLSPASAQTVSYGLDAATTEPVVYGGKLAQLIFQHCSNHEMTVVKVGDVQDANLVWHAVYRDTTEVLGYGVPDENNPMAAGEYAISLEAKLIRKPVLSCPPLHLRSQCFKQFARQSRRKL